MTKDSPTERFGLLVIHGPNLNMLGRREVAIYGSVTLEQIEEQLGRLAQALNFDLECRQSNHEGELIDWLHDADEDFDGVLINPGALSHTSYALADAIRSISIPCVEAHLSNIHSREPFRNTSVTASACLGAILGFGPSSYLLGLRALADFLHANQDDPLPTHYA